MSKTKQPLFKARQQVTGSQEKLIKAAWGESSQVILISQAVIMTPTGRRAVYSGDAIDAIINKYYLFTGSEASGFIALMQRQLDKTTEDLDRELMEMSTEKTQTTREVLRKFIEYCEKREGPKYALRGAAEKYLGEELDK